MQIYRYTVIFEPAEEGGYVVHVPALNGAATQVASKEYTTVLLTHYGQWVQPARRHATGPAPKPRWMPLPQLLYA